MMIGYTLAWQCLLSKEVVLLTESIKICFRVNSLSGEVNLMGRNSQQRQQQNPKPPRSSLQDSLSIRSKITLESPLFMSFSLRTCSILKIVGDTIVRAVNLINRIKVLLEIMSWNVNFMPCPMSFAPFDVHLNKFCHCLSLFYALLHSFQRLFLHPPLSFDWIQCLTLGKEANFLTPLGYHRKICLHLSID